MTNVSETSEISGSFFTDQGIVLKMSLSLSIYIYIYIYILIVNHEYMH